MSGSAVTSTAVAVAETHSAVVFFLGDHAYKVKKPVNFGFLDFRTREARRAVCEREVELNRRLAPDVYEGVADVVGPDGRPCDHLVVMRRMPVDRRLSFLVTTGAATSDHVRGVARVVAAFHARSPTSADIEATATRDAMAGRWDANVTEIRRVGRDVIDLNVVDDVGRLAGHYLAGRERLFSARVAAGRARDGHGDLLADDIFCLDDGPRVLDCIEFDDRLRWGDTLADLAFLAMDLERLGRPDLAATFLDYYRELAADSWPASLAHHHIAYRALVRAKVACIRHAQGDASAAPQARQHVTLARDHLLAGRVRLILVGGLPGTGKSTLAAGLSDALGFTVLRSDEVRKDVVGMSHAEHAPASPGEGIYGPEVTAATYRELLARGRSALHMGETVILDASWHDRAWRDDARELADTAAAELVEVRCTVTSAVAAARMKARAAKRSDPSDATDSVASDMAQAFQPWPSAMTVLTDAEPNEVLAAVCEALQPVGSAAPRAVV